MLYFNASGGLFNHRKQGRELQHLTASAGGCSMLHFTASEETYERGLSATLPPLDSHSNARGLLIVA